MLLSPGILYKIPECGLEIDLENPIKLQVLAAIQAKFIGWKKYGLSIVLLFHFMVITTYQEIVVLKYYILQRSKVLYQLHFN